MDILQIPWTQFCPLLNSFVLKPLEERQRTEKDAVRIATEMHAEFWSVSSKTGKAKNLHSSVQVVHFDSINAMLYGPCSKPLRKCVFVIFTGENVQNFFFRVAALAFEKCILKDTENGVTASIGYGDSISKCGITSQQTQKLIMDDFEVYKY